MMRKVTIIGVFLLLLVTTICCTNSRDFHLKMNKDCYNSIETYIASNNDYQAFLLIPKQEKDERFIND